MGVNDLRNSITCGAFLFAAAVLAGGYPAAAQAPAPANPDPTLRVIERILVKVNGEIITQSDLEDRQVGAIRARGTQPGTNAELMQLIREVTPEVLAKRLRNHSPRPVRVSRGYLKHYCEHAAPASEGAVMPR